VGVLRAKAGHPAPFGLKYVEIGNEDGFNPLYPDRYKLIYDAIKTRFPEVQIIANEKRGGFANLPMDFIDEHSYTQPLGAIDLAKRLDGRDRNGTKAVLGGIRCSDIGRLRDMRGALGEAIMLSGIERNSEIMPMASYAPLLAHVRAINWRPDLTLCRRRFLIWQSSLLSTEDVGRFRLVSVVPVQVNASEMKVYVGGEVKAEGWDAQADFQDEKVTGSGECRGRRIYVFLHLSVKVATRDSRSSPLWLFIAD
jgi:hypothetical protein